MKQHRAATCHIQCSQAFGQILQTYECIWKDSGSIIQNEREAVPIQEYDKDNALR